MLSTASFEAGYVDDPGRRLHNYGMAKTKRRTFIKQWRDFREMTQEQLADKTDMSPGNISLIERGLQNYTQETLESIAGALKCEPADLLTRDPGDPSGLWPVWDSADPDQRKMIVDIVKTVVKSER